MRQRGGFIFLHGTWEDYIRSIILDWKERPTGPSSKPVSSPMCVLWLLHYFTKRVHATEERYVRTLSDCIPTSHKHRHWRRTMSFSFFVQVWYVTPLPQVKRHYLAHSPCFTSIVLNPMVSYSTHFLLII